MNREYTVSVMSALVSFLITLIVFNDNFVTLLKVYFATLFIMYMVVDQLIPYLRNILLRK